MDYFGVSESVVGRFGGLRTWAMGESDHAARSVRYRLAPQPHPAGRRPWRAQGFRGQQMAVGRLRDPEVRERFQEAASAAIEGKGEWGDIAEALGVVGTEVLGTAPRVGLDPTPGPMATRLSEARSKAKSLFDAARASECPERSKLLLRESRMWGKTARRLIRVSTQSQWAGVCGRLEEADAKGGLRSFHAEMRAMKLYGLSMARPVRF